MTGGFTELGMRFLRWKTICAAAMCAPLFAIAQQQPSDYAREKRWADEIVPQLVSARSSGCGFFAGRRSAPPRCARRFSPSRSSSPPITRARSAGPTRSSRSSSPLGARDAVSSREDDLRRRDVRAAFRHRAAAALRLRAREALGRRDRPAARLRSELGMRFLRGKTICAAAMCAPLFAIAQQQPSDYAREKRWADEIVPQLV